MPNSDDRVIVISGIEDVSVDFHGSQVLPAASLVLYIVEDNCLSWPALAINSSTALDYLLVKERI